MPLSPEYTWTQDERAVELHVALKGTPARKVDVYVSDLFVKLNFAPYLLQLDLLRPVAFDRAVVLADEGAVVLRERIASPQGDYGATIAALTGLVTLAESRVGQRCPVGICIPGTVSSDTALVKNANSVWLNGQPLVWMTVPGAFLSGATSQTSLRPRA